MDRGTGANMTPGGLFQDGAVGGQDASWLNALWCNGVTEELRNVIVAGGLAPDANDWTQLLQALNILFERRNSLAATVVHRDGTLKVASSADAQIPTDSSLPQQTEGVAYAELNAAITPMRTTSRLRITVHLPTVSAKGLAVFALFRDDLTDAIRAWAIDNNSTTVRVIHPLTLIAVVDTVAIAETTFKLRFSSADQIAINRFDNFGGIDPLGVADSAEMMIEEIP